MQKHPSPVPGMRQQANQFRRVASAAITKAGELVGAINRNIERTQQLMNQPLLSREIVSKCKSRTVPYSVVTECGENWRLNQKLRERATVLLQMNLQLRKRAASLLAEPPDVPTTDMQRPNTSGWHPNGGHQDRRNMPRTRKNTPALDPAGITEKIADLHAKAERLHADVDAMHKDVDKVHQRARAMRMEATRTRKKAQRQTAKLLEKRPK